MPAKLEIIESDEVSKAYVTIKEGKFHQIKRMFETLNKEVDGLYDQIADLIAEKRLLNEKVATFSDSEVRGSITNEVPTIDEEDGWE